jgi:enolase
MIALDGTENKGRLGANAILAVSVPFLGKKSSQAEYYFSLFLRI